jgi:hypothetical protein
LFGTAHVDLYLISDYGTGTRSNFKFGVYKYIHTHMYKQSHLYLFKFNILHAHHRQSPLGDTKHVAHLEMQDVRAAVAKKRESSGGSAT